MSKFKVGDKVVMASGDPKEIGEVELIAENSGDPKEIGEVELIAENSGLIRASFDYGFEVTHYWYNESQLKPYKTPHQELLDLGYTLISESEIYVNYTMVIDTKAIHLTFDKLLRRYKTWITYTPTGDKVPVFVSKTEAELFARYLDYMENWREFVKDELE